MEFLPERDPALPPVAIFYDDQGVPYCLSNAVLDNLAGLGTAAEGKELLERADESIRKPKRLYKYRPVNTNNSKDLDRLRSLIVNNRVFVSSLPDFNDPFDGKFVVEKPDRKSAAYNLVIKEQTKRLFPDKSREERRKHAKTIRRRSFDPVAAAKNIENGTSARTGVLCLSETPSSVLMWSHYSNNHTGICLQYSTEYDPFFIMAMKVIYGTDFPSITFPASRGKLPFTKKSIEWSYEKEWRVLVDAIRCNIELDSRSLAGVIYGARCSAITRESVRALLIERQIKGHSPLSEMDACLSATSYAISIEPSAKN